MSGRNAPEVSDDDCRYLHDTSILAALRDIQALVARGVLLKSEAGGRSSSYALPGVTPDGEKRS